MSVIVEGCVSDTYRWRRGGLGGRGGGGCLQGFDIVVRRSADLECRRLQVGY